MKSGLITICIACFLGLFACSSGKGVPMEIVELRDTILIQKRIVHDEFEIVPNEDIISDLLDTSILNSGFTGIFLYDLMDNTILYQKNPNHYFVPASNTKILTLFVCLHTLGDSITALKYVETDSTFTFWGTADPTLLHPFFPASDIIAFLKSKIAHKTVYYSDIHSSLQPYGKGWMWDDYNDYYQAELTSFPMYGNVVKISKDTAVVSILPEEAIEKITKNTASKKVKRKFENNTFEFPTSLDSLQTYYQEVPFKNAAEINIRLLEEAIGKVIIKKEIPIPTYVMTKYSLPVDTVYRRMMQVSDNMLAEHLLLQCGMSIADTLSTIFAIDTIMSKYAGILDTSSVWVDGSGLSRYNLFTPEMMGKVLISLHRDIPEEKLFSLMAIGGGNGSLKKMFNKESVPYVFAKPGSMAGVYNLSGYMITKSGKKLAFSIMNNNLTCTVTNARKVVGEIVEMVRLRY